MKGLYISCTLMQPGKHRHRPSSREHRCLYLVTALSPQPRRPIAYGAQIRPPKGWTLQQLEEKAWAFRDRGVRVEDTDGFGPGHAINRSIRRIQELIIEQYGLPTGG